MAKYVALKKGQINGPNGGRVIAEGEVFEHEFMRVKRKGEQRNKDGVLVKAGEIVRDKDGNPEREKSDPPSWAELADKSAAATQAVQEAEKGHDVNIDEMNVTELKAHAAGLTPPVDLTGIRSKDDMLAAIKGRPDPTR